MNHRKTHSQGSIPFLWEEKPGISKFNHQKSNPDIGITHHQEYLLSHDHMINIAPPPPTRKSYSGRSFGWQDDPFIAALKSCTKSTTHRGYGVFMRQKKHVPYKEKKSSVWSSCMQSCDVETDYVIKFSKLPPIPKERYTAKSFVRTN